ncbi:hypothetical protein ACFYY8_17510 [Streptosporangium sp. NPDC001559]
MSRKVDGLIQLADHRLGSWKVWQAALTGPDADRVRELREARTERAAR